MSAKKYIIKETTTYEIEEVDDTPKDVTPQPELITYEEVPSASQKAKHYSKKGLSFIGVVLSYIIKTPLSIALWGLYTVGSFIGAFFGWIFLKIGFAFAIAVFLAVVESYFHWLPSEATTETMNWVYANVLGTTPDTTFLIPHHQVEMPIITGVAILIGAFRTYATMTGNYTTDDFN